MAGKVCTTKQAVSHHRGEPLGRNLCTTPRISGSVLHAPLKSTRAFHESDCPPLLSLKSGKRCCTSFPRQRISVKCECRLSSNPFCSIGGRCRVLNNLDIRNGVFRKSENVKINRTRAYYKSEDYDAKAEPLASVDGSGEAVLVEASPWWQKFPKRWGIVLLCFAAFLLCNMDRVSASFVCSFPQFRPHSWSLSITHIFQIFNH